MIKLIASDMDGTLLNDEMKISAGNVAAIKKAQSMGVEFLVATGREIKEAKPLVEEQGLSTGFISLNGAKVFDTDGKQVVDIPIKRETALNLMHQLKDDGFYFEIVTSNGVYSDNRTNRISNIANLLVDLNPDTTYKIAVALASARLELMNINYTDNYFKLFDDPKFEMMKVIVFSPQGQKGFAGIRDRLAGSKELIITSSSENNIEINNFEAQKGIALEKYAASRGIKMEEVMAIGDNLNDESMIRMAGVGVAMGNAVEQILAIADYVTDVNTKDGVGKAILHYLDK